MKKSRGSQMIRQWKLLRACARSAGMSIDELIDLFGASRRTIYRDLSILKASGAKIETLKVSKEIKYRTSQPFFDENSIAANQ